MCLMLTLHGCLAESSDSHYRMITHCLINLKECLAAFLACINKPAVDHLYAFSGRDIVAIKGLYLTLIQLKRDHAWKLWL